MYPLFSTDVIKILKTKIIRLLRFYLSLAYRRLNIYAVEGSFLDSIIRL